MSIFPPNETHWHKAKGSLSVMKVIPVPILQNTKFINKKKKKQTIKPNKQQKQNPKHPLLRAWQRLKWQHKAHCNRSSHCTVPLYPSCCEGVSNSLFHFNNNKNIVKTSNSFFNSHVSISFNDIPPFYKWTKKNLLKTFTVNDAGVTETNCAITCFVVPAFAKLVLKTFTIVYLILKASYF